MDLHRTAFTSDRLSLRAFTADDAQEAFAEATPVIARFMSWDPSPTLEAFAGVWREWLPRMEAGIDLSLVLRLKSTNEFLGVTGLHRIGNPEVELGIWLKQAAHSLGYARESLAAIIAWAGPHIGATAFIYPVAKENRPSRRLAESLGGVVVGSRILAKASGVRLNEVVYRIPGVAE